MVSSARGFVIVAVSLSAMVSGCKFRDSLFSSTQETPEETQQLTVDVKTILKDNCSSCHGASSAGEGGINYIENLSALVSRGKVIPKNLKSRIYLRMSTKTMPPRGVTPAPSDADIETIKRWIELGAPSESVAAFGRPLVSTEGLYRLMQADMLSVPEANRSFIRYVTFQNILNAAALDGRPLINDEEFATYKKGFFKLINSVSLGQDIVLPVEVAESGGAIWRIDLRSYGITAATWNNILSTSPYKLNFQFSERASVVAGLGTEFPDVRADWFVSVASIPPFYHDLLQIPSTLPELEAQLGININNNIRAGQVQRLAFNRSGVSNFNRLIERHLLPNGNGAFWTSYDFGGTQAGQNLLALPLGPAPVFPAEKSFRHDGGETIWNLANGLQAYVLTTSDGKRINVGPVNIVSDPIRPDRQVINGLSCMHCHAEGIKRKDDEVHDLVTKNRALYADADQILALYKGKAVNDQAFDQDQARFNAALAKLGIKPDDPEPTLALQKHIEAEVTGSVAAAEFGLSYEDFVEKFNQLSDAQFANQKRDMAPLITVGGTVKRDIFAASFRAVAEGMGLLTQSTNPETSTTEYTCFAEAFEKGKSTVIQTSIGTSRRSEEEARQKSLISCRRLIEGLSLYDCRISTTKQCESKRL